ncbi:MAG TPA: FGGY family carbohydrate kinase, partial [Spirochaetia bacterium]
MKRRVVLGVDIGTSSVKYGLIDEKGQFFRSSSGEYALRADTPGEFEIDPEELWGSVASSIRSLLADVGDSCTVEA